MTRRKKRAVELLGPDGKPVDMEAMRRERQRQAEPEPKPELSVADYARAGSRDISADMTFDFTPSLHRLFFGHFVKATPAEPKKASLAERVDADLRALGVDPTDTAQAELPRTPRDLTAYGDAYDRAVELCPHDDIESTTYAKGEYQCQDCGKYLSRADMRKRNSGGPFGWYFR